MNLGSSTPVVIDLSRVSMMPRSRTTHNAGRERSTSTSTNKTNGHDRQGARLWKDRTALSAGEQTDIDTAGITFPAVDFDLLYELTENRKSYASYDRQADGTDRTESSADSTAESSASHLTLLSFPQSCRLNLDRLRTRIDPKPASMHSALSCALHWGCITLTDLHPIRALQSLKHRFNDAPPTLDRLISSTIDGFLNLSSSVIDLPTSGRRTSARVPSGILRTAGDLASDIGMQLHTIAVISIMLALATQPSTNTGDAADMRACVERFLQTVSVRARAIEALMEEFGV